MSTYSSLHFHIVFSTRGRLPFLKATWRDDLYQYIGGTIRGLGGVALCIGGIEDHIHLLVGLSPSHQIPDIVREIKKSSTKWIREKQKHPRFQWQEGYGVFSVSKSAIKHVSAYISCQEEHHRTRSFVSEYKGLLQQHGVSFEEKYLPG